MKLKEKNKNILKIIEIIKNYFKDKINFRKLIRSVFNIRKSVLSFNEFQVYSLKFNLFLASKK